MNKKKVILMTMISLSAVPAFAQSEKGNGDLNRSVLEQGMEIDPSIMDKVSLDEVMQKMKDEMTQFSSSGYEGESRDSSPYWTQLTPQGRQALVDSDAYLSSLVEKSIEILDHAQQDIASDLGYYKQLIDVSKTSSAAPYSKEVNARIAKIKERNNLRLNYSISVATDELFDNARKINPRLPGIPKCDTAVCWSIAKSKMDNYFEFINKIGSTRVTAFGTSSSFSHRCSAYLRGKYGLGSFGRTMRILKQQYKESFQRNVVNGAVN